MAFFTPDRYIDRISSLDVERDILGAGFTHLLVDMDNTLLRRDNHQVPVDIKQWLNKARAANLQICLLSNNFHHGVYEWAERLDLPIVAKAIKPLPHGFIMARNKIGGTRRSTLVVGDQLITDVLGAHFLGMKAYMVVPLVSQDLKHTLVLRHVEAVFMGDKTPETAATCSGEDTE